MNSRLTIPLLTMAAATNALGCYSTWDLKPEMVVKLDGFSGAPRKLEVNDGGERKEIEFTSDTYLHFHDSRGYEVSTQFHSLRMKGPLLVGIEQESGEQLNVDLRGIRLIQVSELSTAKTTAATIGYIAGLVPVIGGLAFGIYFTFDLNPSGRPLRVEDRASPIAAPLVFNRSHKGRRRASGLHGPTRTRLFAHWAQEASAECASVPAFLALARDLARVSAPTNLVQAALRAAREEAKHTRLCTELANKYADAPIAAMTPPVPKVVDSDLHSLLERLVLEAFWDGCVAEGSAAATARRATAATKQKSARKALNVIARDEQRHANLARDILVFGLSAGGKSIRRKLGESLEQRRADEEKRLDAWAAEATEQALDQDLLAENGLAGRDIKHQARIETWEKSVSMLETMGCV